MMQYPASFDRALSRMRKGLLIGLILLFLPWLFFGNLGNALRWPTDDPNPGDEPITIRDFQPVPVSYPVAIRFTDMPIQALGKWIQDHYPGSLVDNTMLEQIAQAAKTADVSIPLLLGILGAEQSFLSNGTAGGELHDLQFYKNPFDYGVFPGSPFEFDIGAYKSALGAARMVAQTIEAMPPGAWSQLQYQQFFGTLENYYVHGWSTMSTQLGNWAKSVESIWEDTTIDGAKALEAEMVDREGELAQAWQEISQTAAQVWQESEQVAQETGQTLENTGQAVEGAVGAVGTAISVVGTKAKVIDLFTRKELVDVGVDSADAADVGELVGGVVEVGGDVAVGALAAAA